MKIKLRFRDKTQASRFYKDCKEVYCVKIKYSDLNFIKELDFVALNKNDTKLLTA